MITQLKIENYKSIQDLTLDVGRVNVLIGENGCGKSNILEAITLAAAAEANRLDDEFLENRGVRVTNPELMRSIFNKENFNKEIRVIVELNKTTEQLYIIRNDNSPYGKWEIYYDEDSYATKNNISKIQAMIKKLERNMSQDNEILLFENFIIYSPENTILRDFSKESIVKPLGYKGDGLLRLLIEIQNDSKGGQDYYDSDSEDNINDIKESLELFGWFESLEIPNELSPLERKITIKDRYLEMPFDQRSANEGFLLVLFYITLVVSKYTPKIFAIDNIDTSLNPKLCTKLIKELTRLAKKYDKQIFLTSHNPAILDGIDLSDEEQRLFVVSRNREGHTRCKRLDVNAKPKSSVRDRLSRIFTEDKLYSREEILNAFDNSDEPLNLSYALLRGYLGGLPKNF